jgi:hypothetical protein
MKSLNEAYKDEYSSGREMRKERELELAKKGSEGYKEVRKAVDGQCFLLCRKAANALEALDVEIDRASEAEDFYEHCEMAIEAISKCLAVLPGIAKKDLGVN